MSRRNVLRCSGVTVSGARCKARASYGCFPYCAMHWCALQRSRV